MKTENKETTLLSSDAPDAPKLKFADILVLAVNSEVRQGMNIQEMRQRVDLIEALDAAEGEIELDEEQTVLMRRLWKEHRWKVPHPDILKVDEAIAK